MFNLYGIENYSDLLEALQNGAKLCKVMEMRDGTKTLHPVLSADNKYIRWNCYGSSANEATPRGMEFVVTRIFKTDLDSIIRAYVWA